MIPLRHVYLELGSSYLTIGEYERSSEYAQFAESIYSSINFTSMATEAKQQFAKIKAVSGASSQTIPILDECLEQLSESADAIQEDVILGEIARVHLMDKNYDLSKNKAAAALSVISENHVASAPILKTLAVAEMELGNTAIGLSNYLKNRKQSFLKKDRYRSLPKQRPY